VCPDVRPASGGWRSPPQHPRRGGASTAVGGRFTTVVVDDGSAAVGGRSTTVVVDDGSE
jgi:hypothetical protein